ncbi:uncharacterized protein [Montipora foliosa]|uniref:uncharacterized protein n=1 Tax=Montipora foliosa TaxID=591990 RepID=UPI0035F12C52
MSQLRSIVLLVLSPVAVVANALILAAIWKGTFQRTWLYVLLSGLAFSDFCIGLIVQPLLALLFFLFLDESVFAYYKVYRIIHQHQQQVQGNQSSQNFGQPAINVAKYKRSVKCMLYIFALFSVTLTPVVVGIAFLLSRAENLSCLEAFSVFYVSLSICFLSPSLNPAIYL